MLDPVADSDGSRPPGGVDRNDDNSSNRTDGISKKKHILILFAYALVVRSRARAFTVPNASACKCGRAGAQSNAALVLRTFQISWPLRVPDRY